VVVLCHKTTTYCVYWRTTTTTTQSEYDHILCLLTNNNNNKPNHNTTTCCVLWLGVLLFSSVSKHNIWSYYDWVYCCRPSPEFNNRLFDKNSDFFFLHQNQNIFFSNIGNQNIFLEKTTTPFKLNGSSLTDGRKQRQPNHNTTTYIWSYYDWIYCCCCPSVNTICSRIMIELSLLSSVSKHNNKPSHNTTTYCVYLRTTTTTTQS
jgi:hypothetical protein